MPSLGIKTQVRRDEGGRIIYRAVKRGNLLLGHITPIKGDAKYLAIKAHDFEGFNILKDAVAWLAE